MFNICSGIGCGKCSKKKREPTPLNSRSLLQDQINNCSILEHVTSRELETLYVSATELSAKKGTYIIREGAIGTQFFLIVKGTCIVETAEKGQIATIEQGGM